MNSRRKTLCRVLSILCLAALLLPILAGVTANAAGRETGLPTKLSIGTELPVKNLYIPSVPGKESRKPHPGKEGLLGVEGMDAALLRRLLAAVGEAEAAPRSGSPITYADLYELGLSGTSGAAERRRGLLHSTGLPLRLSKRALLQVLNSLYTREELEALCRQLPPPTQQP